MPKDWMTLGGAPAQVQNATGGWSPVVVSYDATSKSYSVTFDDGTPIGRETYRASNPEPSSTPGTAVYRDTTGGITRTLTLTSRSPSTGAAYDYVASGSRLREQQDGSVIYQPFVYGFPTSAQSVPHSGAASYDVDVTGLVTFIGSKPRSATGSGRFNTDFLSGLYSLNASLRETDQQTGALVRTGPLQASGRFASDGSFTGPITYEDFDSTWIGTIDGRLYGPDAKEMGATFALGAHGIFDGSIVGTKNPSGPTESLALTNLVATQAFPASQVKLGEDPFGASNGVSLRHASDFTLGPDGSATYRSIGGAVGAFTSADQVPASGSNFTIYRKSVDGYGAELDLYKPSGANGELALTYASFGAWQISNTGDLNRPSREFFTYGVLTPYWQLARKTGTAQYSGTVHGGSEAVQTGLRYELTGSVHYTVDFSSSAYSGSIAIQGVNPNGGGSGRNFGVFDVNGGVPLAANTPPGGDFANVWQNGVFVGQISNRFFGPDGEEIAGIFNLTVDGAFTPSRTFLTGVAAAKRN